MTATASLEAPIDPRHPAARLAALFDEGTLVWLHAPDKSGMASALGRTNGVAVVAFCSDPTVMGGAMGVEGCRVVVEAYQRALTDRVPIIGVWHSGGARLEVAVNSSFSEARRLAFYRAMAVRNLLIEMGVPVARIDISIHEVKPGGDSTKVLVRGIK